MLDPKNYLIMEVAHQSKVVNVDVCEDNVHMGFEPQSELELTDTDCYPKERLVGTLFGKAALHQFKKGDKVAVCLSHRGYKKDGEFINRIHIDDIWLINELDYLYL